MQMSNILSALLLGASVVAGLPEPQGGRGKKDVLYARAAPKRVTCAASDNGPDRNYTQKSYTSGQLEAAFKKGATLQAAGKTEGVNKYPHRFNKAEKLQFECKYDKQEFVITQDGKAYAGGATDREPDQLVYEYKEDKKGLHVSFCGVIRHGPNGGRFVLCQ